MTDAPTSVSDLEIKIGCNVTYAAYSVRALLATVMNQHAGCSMDAGDFSTVIEDGLVRIGQRLEVISRALGEPNGLFDIGGAIQQPDCETEQPAGERGHD
jgi:hypothetical protein